MASATGREPAPGINGVGVIEVWPARSYIAQSVMVKAPDPLQPAPVPVSVQLPVIEPPVNVPTIVSSFVPLVFEDPDCTVSWKLPVVTPPEVPVTVKAPVAVVPKAKHDDVVVKLRLVTLSVPLFPVRVTVKARAVDPSVLFSVAVQFPLMLLLPLELPQPDNASAIESMIAIPECFIKSSTK